MKLSNSVIFRMYQLKISEKNRDEFVQTGVDNLMSSYDAEPGTLAMIATHTDSAGTDNFVFELYRDLDQYDIHAKSPHFKRFAQTAQRIVTGRSVNELQSEFLLSTDDSFSISGNNEYEGHLLELSLEDDNRKFKDQLQKNLREKLISTEDMVISLVGKMSDSQHWLVLNIYKHSRKLDSVVDLGEITTNYEVIDEKKLFVDTMICRSQISLD